MTGLLSVTYVGVRAKSCQEQYVSRQSYALIGVHIFYIILVYFIIAQPIMRKLINFEATSTVQAQIYKLHNHCNEKYTAKIISYKLLTVY